MITSTYGRLPSIDDNVSISSGSRWRMTAKTIEAVAVTVAEKGIRRGRKTRTRIIWSLYNYWQYNSKIYHSWQGTTGYFCAPPPGWRSF